VKVDRKLSLNSEVRSLQSYSDIQIITVQHVAYGCCCNRLSYTSEFM